MPTILEQVVADVLSETTATDFAAGVKELAAAHAFLKACQEAGTDPSNRADLARWLTSTYRGPAVDINNVAVRVAYILKKKGVGEAVIEDVSDVAMGDIEAYVELMRDAQRLRASHNYPRAQHALDVAKQYWDGFTGDEKQIARGLLRTRGLRARGMLDPADVPV